MNLGLAQIAPRLGDLAANFDLHREWIESARKEKVDLLVFPELSLTGYSLRDLTAEVALDPAAHPYFKTFRSLSRGIAVVVGFIEESAAEPGLYYNAAALFEGGELRGVHRKVYLPTGGLFEEGRFFARGRDFAPVKTGFGTAGLMICRDFLHLGSSYLNFVGGAEVQVVVSAAPGRGVGGGEAFETSRMWELMGEAVSFFTTSYVLYCNRVGFEDGVSFAGGSFVYDPRGERVAQASYLEPGLLLAAIDLTAVRDARRRWTFLRDERPEVILHALERTVRRP